MPRNGDLIGGYKVLSVKVRPFGGNLNPKRLARALNHGAGDGWKCRRKIREGNRLWLYFEREPNLLILIQEKDQLTTVLLER